MSAERYAFDTNIYFYAVDCDAGEKHVRALNLLKSVDATRIIVLLQTLGELANSITKKKPERIDSAQRLIRQMERLEVVQTVPEDVHAALRAHQEHGLPFGTRWCGPLQDVLVALFSSQRIFKMVAV